jgi:hypothetical protein
VDCDDIGAAVTLTNELTRRLDALVDEHAAPGHAEAGTMLRRLVDALGPQDGPPRPCDRP